MKDHAAAFVHRTFTCVFQYCASSRLPVLLTLLGIAICASAQSPTIDCYASLESYAITNPGLRCTCASATSSPNCGSGSGKSGGIAPTLSTKQMMQQEIAATVVSSFLNMLFSNDSQANAQKQKMMAELAQRQAAAEQQHKIEEAKRLAAICSRLQASLKLSGLPTLQLKGAGESTGTGGLHLKLGDSSSDHVGVPGLPGIALNDNTGNGGNTPYGIKGLPGIYTNGPATPPTPPSGRPHSSGGGLQLKIGEGGTASGPAANGQPAPADGALPAEPVTDARSMTPQQLADLAARVNDLPPEEQQRLMAAAQANAQAGGGSAPQPAASQLQQVAGTSQAAANAQTLEGARAQAQSGFDRAIAVTPGSTAASVVTAQPTPPVTTANSNQTAPAPANTPAPATVGGRVHVPVTLPVMAVDSHTSGSQKAPVVTQLSTGIAGRASGCPIDSTKRLPTREELAQELAGLRFKLDVLKNSLLRLNRSIQMDQGQFAEWEKQTQDAVDRSNERLKKAIEDKIEERFFKYAEGYYDKAPEKLAALKRVEVLLNENSVYDWADKGDKSWDQVAEGLDLLGSTLPLSDQAKDVLWASKNTIDSAFDIATELTSWRRISQLQKNSDAYLIAVKQSGEQMKKIVGRMREIEDRLASGSYATGISPRQAGVTPCE